MVTVANPTCRRSLCKNQEREERYSIMKHRGRLLIILTLAAILLPGCVPALAPQESAKAPAVQSNPSSPVMPEPRLPEPRLRGTLSLEEALAQRRSIRSFGVETLTMAELGQLLWAAQGLTTDSGLRTVPSAGALYPLEVYAVTPDGVYHYRAKGHQVVPHVAGDVRPALAAAASHQSSVADAPAVIVIAAVYARTAQKYGQTRSSRYVALEAGHAAQNVLLQAVALSLGAVPVGAFDDVRVQGVLELPADHQPLYLIPVGHPG